MIQNHKYLIEIAEPKGIFCNAIKNVDSETTPTSPRRNKSFGLFPIIGILRISIVGNMKINVPIARKNTTCIGWKLLNSLAVALIMANAKVAMRIKNIPFEIIDKCKTKIDCVFEKYFILTYNIY